MSDSEAVINWDLLPAWCEQHPCCDLCGMEPAVRVGPVTERIAYLCPSDVKLMAIIDKGTKPPS